MKIRGFIYLIFCLNLYNALLLPVDRLRLFGMQKMLRNERSNCIAPLKVLLHCTKQQNEYDDINIQSSNSTINELETPETNSTVPIVDEVSRAIANKEAQLREEVQKLEDILRTERLNLSKVKDKISESGKTGFYIIQAQVNDYARKRNTEQKLQVERNKREFIEKILPWIDEFRKAPATLPAIENKTHTMHNSFGSLLKHVLAVFEKYGYREYTPVPGDELSEQLHEIIEIRNTTVDTTSTTTSTNTTTTSSANETEIIQPSVVVEVHRPGLSNKDGDIIRKAQVVVSQPQIPTSDIVSTSIPEDKVTAGLVEEVRDTGKDDENINEQQYNEDNEDNSDHYIEEDSIQS